MSNVISCLWHVYFTIVDIQIDMIVESQTDPCASDHLVVSNHFCIAIN